MDESKRELLRKIGEMGFLEIAGIIILLISLGLIFFPERIPTH